VLVVDDNIDGASMFEVYLRGMGHTATTAADGATALRIAHDAPLDVALVDIGLPVMDGYELARRLRAELGAQTPVLIAVTGYGQDSDRARAREAGFNHHLVKPVELAKLDELLATVPRADGEITPPG
jgi:CheY-like chemotaxis protein